MEMTFVPRSELPEFEWDHQEKQWRKPGIDRKVLRELAERSTLNGLARVGLFFLFLGVSAAATIVVSQFSVWLAIPFLYVYYFFYGFWVAIGHELQHSTVFAAGFDRVSKVFFFFVQALMWNSPRYAKISHRLHHRYTMLRGVDPETEWPEVITTSWLHRYLGHMMLRIFVVGAISQWFRELRIQVRRVIGKKDRMMIDHCKEEDIRAIRLESAGILIFHACVIGVAVWFRRWEPIVFITLAWQIGSPIETLWHSTEHIGRMYDVNDQRCATRSVKVGPLVKLIYWGLDDHVDHHNYPIVPSRNLPKLHKLLQEELPEPLTMVQCWREMFRIAAEKDQRPGNEFVPTPPGVPSN